MTLCNVQFYVIAMLFDFFPLPGNHMILPKVSNVNKNETEIANGNKQYKNSHFFIYFCIYL